MKNNKYGAKKKVVNGITFDSTAEADYYIQLKGFEKLGVLKILELQPKVYLTEARILYKPDFLVEQDGERFYVDVKGVETSGFKLKFRLWKYYGPSFPLKIVVKKNNRFIETKKQTPIPHP